MNSKGWIKIHRKILNHQIFDNPNLLKMWLWCLLKASHTGYKQMIGLEEIEVKEGQFITGRNKGATELGVNPSTWYKHLKVLEQLGMIEIECNNKMTAVTIVNWRLYQGEQQEEYQQKNNEITTKEQQNNTNKKVKNVKKVKKVNNNVATKAATFEENSPEFWLAKFLHQKIKENDPEAKEPNLQNWAVHIDRLIRLDNREPREIMKVIEWTQQDDFWKANILSTNKLRQQYPRLRLQMNQSAARASKAGGAVYTEENKQAIREFINE